MPLYCPTSRSLPWKRQITKLTDSTIKPVPKYDLAKHLYSENSSDGENAKLVW